MSESHIPHPNPPERPTWQNETILATVAHEIVAEIPDVARDATAYIDVVKALKNHAPFWDAYLLARYLDDHFSWICNAESVEACEMARGAIAIHLGRAVATWVTAYGIQPRYKVGNSVRITTRGPDRHEHEYDGEVVGVDGAHAEYTVMIPALGHVRSGLGAHGIRVPFEQLHPLGQAEACVAAAA